MNYLQFELLGCTGFTAQRRRHTASAIFKTDNQYTVLIIPSNEINFQLKKCATQLFYETRLIDKQRNVPTRPTLR